MRIKLGTNDKVVLDPILNISNEHLYVLGYKIDKSLEKEGLELKKNDFFQCYHFFNPKILLFLQKFAISGLQNYGQRHST